MWKFPKTLFILMLFSFENSYAEVANTGNSVKSEKQKIKIACTNQPQSTLIHIAHIKGFFTEEGLEVEPIHHSHGKASLHSVLEDKADIAVASETSIMFSILDGKKIFIFANIEMSNSNNAIIGRKESGITIPENLKAKRIGFTPGTTSDFFLDAFLSAHGLSRKDIHSVPMKSEEIEKNLMLGKIDAASVWNYPLAQIKKALAEKTVIFYDKELYTETFNLVTKQEFAQKNPEAIKRFLRALFKAENFIKKYTDVAQEIMAKETSIELDLIKEVWNSFRYSLELDQRIIISLEDEARWAIKNNLTEATKIPDFKKYIQTESLMAVMPRVIRLTN